VFSSESSLSGFLLNNQTCHAADDGKFSLKFHSIFSFRKWIDAVIDIVGLKNRDYFVVRVFEYLKSDSDVVKRSCVGTAITQRHVLTTATCVTVTGGEGYGIAVKAQFEGSVSMFKAG
jgi:hypothetical protein